MSIQAYHCAHWVDGVIEILWGWWSINDHVYEVAVIGRWRQWGWLEIMASEKINTLINMLVSHMREYNVAGFVPCHAYGHPSLSIQI